MHKLGLWTLAMEFMKLEHEGFPGRLVLGPSGGGLTPCPKPTILRSGWSSNIDYVAETAARLPMLILDAAKKGELKEEAIFRGVHARIVKLDGFLNRMWCPVHNDTAPPSLAAQIDRSWPWNITQIEPFSIANQVATAYPRYQRGTITVLSIVALVLILSTLLSVLSVQRTPEVGFWADADFLATCQQSLISSSGIVILIYTVFFRSDRIAKQAWHSAWILGLLSLSTAVAAVPVYSLVSPRWSAALSGVSGVAQMWVSVMLMFYCWLGCSGGFLWRWEKGSGWRLNQSSTKKVYIGIH